MNVCKSFLYYFAIELTLPFPEFAEWCESSYSPSERVIMSHSTSNISCRIDAKTIRGFLNLPDSFSNSVFTFSKKRYNWLYLWSAKFVDKLTEDFEILKKFLIIRGGFPTVSYEAYVDMEVSIREMIEYDTPGAK